MVEKLKIPILEYHSVNDMINTPLSVTTGNFKRQMEYLSKRGYTTISLDDLYRYYTSKSPLSKKPIIITFDDGYEDNYVNAYPIFKKYGFTATIFLVTGYVDKVVKFELPPASSNGENILSWEEIREMKKNGISFGSHTCSHSFLTRIPDDQAEWEIKESKKRIEEEVEIKVNSFCYPSGDFNEKIKQMVISSQYRVACAEVLPLQEKQDLLCLERIAIYRRDDMLMFRFKLSRLFPFITKRRVLYRQAKKTQMLLWKKSC